MKKDPRNALYFGVRTTYKTMKNKILHVWVVL